MRAKSLRRMVGAMITLRALRLMEAETAVAELTIAEAEATMSQIFAVDEQFRRMVLLLQGREPQERSGRDTRPPGS